MKRRDFISGIAVAASAALIPANAELKPAEFIAPPKMSAWCAGCGRKISRAESGWAHDDMTVRSSLGTPIDAYIENESIFMPRRKARRKVLRNAKPPEFAILKGSPLCKKSDGSSHGVFVHLEP